jgi:Spy/CpxP family protein refolding chaperone
MIKHRVGLLVLLLIPQILTAQPPKSPYVGEETRGIKALSSGEVTRYLQGAGMGLARAAELNRYPGPMHVLELASELKLTDEQKARTEDLFSQTKTEARKLGEQIVELERELDRRFSDGEISEEELSRLVKDIGSKKADLRLVHLRAHLRQRSILSAEQAAHYSVLRGYVGGDER